MKQQKPTKTLHIFAQQSWHEEAFLIGTKEALTAVRDAINMALRDGESSASAFAADGEGYDIIVRVVDESVMNKLALPYTSETAKEMPSIFRKPLSPETLYPMG